MSSDKPPQAAPNEEPLTKEEILYCAEFACWTTLALAPFLYWVNGPAVSTDQFVVRTALVVLAAIGAAVLRTTKILAKRKAS
jgi:hypothetical protein